MRHVSLVLLVIALFAAAPAAMAAEAPEGIAGIELEQHLDEIENLLQMDTLGVEWDDEHFKRVRVKDLPGFEDGYLTVGNCKRVDQVLRIKLQYEDDSKELFERLKKSITRKFGVKPDYRGDPFGTLSLWRWSYTNADGDSISLHLQHYLGEEEYTYGNSIKLGNRSAMEEERRCEWAKSENDDGGVKLDWEKSGIEPLMPY
jgi:hypothetical protein